MMAADPTYGTAAQRASPQASGHLAPAELSAHHNLPWLDRFRRSLIVPASRAFVAWAADIAGPRIVLDRALLQEADLRRWPGGCSILQYDSRASDFRYRQFGASLQQVFGRDLTGEYVSAWAPEMAGPMRDHAHASIDRRIPIGGTIRLARASTSEPERHAIFEQVIWPLRYGVGPVRAVLMLSTPAPEEVGRSPRPAPVAGTGNLSDADGGPLTPPQPLRSASASSRRSEEPLCCQAPSLDSVGGSHRGDPSRKPARPRLVGTVD